MEKLSVWLFLLTAQMAPISLFIFITTILINVFERDTGQVAIKVLNHFIFVLIGVKYLELTVDSNDFSCIVVLLSSNYLCETSLD